MDGAATETTAQVESTRVDVPDFVERTLRSNGLGTEELDLSQTTQDILAQRRRAEKEASTVKTLEEAVSKAAVIDIRKVLADFNGTTSLPANEREQAQAVSKALTQAKQIASRADYVVNILDQFTKYFNAGPYDRKGQASQQLAQALIDQAIESNQQFQDRIAAARQSGQQMEQLERQMIQAEVLNSLPGYVQRASEILKRIRDVDETRITTADPAQLAQDFQALKQTISDLEGLNLFGLKLISSDPKPSSGPDNRQDLDRVVFENWTVNLEDWYSETNPKNMENAIIEAAKFAGGEYAPNRIDPRTGEFKKGGKYAMYTENGDGTITVHLENVNEYIIFRVQEHMNFQDPDDKIEVLGLRLFETPYRSVTLYEFLIHDASKYAQQQTKEGGQVSPLYQDFLLYWALQASSTGHNYNSGIDVRNAAADEEKWAETYKAICRSNKLASAKRLPRELRKLSRQDIKDQIERTGRLNYAEWKEVDGHLGQAVSDYATLEKYIFELSHNSWDIKGHLESVAVEAEFDRRNRAKIIELKKVLGQYTGAGQKPPAPGTQTNLVIDGKRATVGEVTGLLESLEGIRAKIQNGEYVTPDGRKVPKQNFLFKALHGGISDRAGQERAIKEFLLDLTNSYMEQELERDADPSVRFIMERAAAAKFSFMDLIQGKDLPQGITDADRNAIINNICVRAGYKKDTGQSNLTPDRLQELARGDFGKFAEFLFGLEGNLYKKANLNIFSEYGTVAKEPIKGLVTKSFKNAVARRYAELTSAEEERVKQLRQKDKSTLTREEVRLLERADKALTASEIEYVYEAGKEVAEWSMRKAQNDTGVSGNEFPVRVAHPADYFRGNLANLNIGEKETLNIIRNTQDMMNGVPISVLVTDIEKDANGDFVIDPKTGKPKMGQQWSEIMWLGEFMERGMYTQSEIRNKPEFGEQSLSIFYTRRVEAAYKMYKGQRDVKSQVYDIGKYLVGYVLGDAEYAKQGINQYLAQRNVLADFLFTTKYPLPYKRYIREWVNEPDEKGKTSLVCKTLKTEEYLLGKSVFALEDVVMSNPDIKEKVEKGDWTRGHVLEAMTELAFIGATLRSKIYYYLPRELKEHYESGMDGVISAWGVKEAINVMVHSELGRFGGGKEKLIKLPNGKYRVDTIYDEGHRFTQEMGEKMFEIMTGLPLSYLDWYDTKQTMSGIATGFLWDFLSTLFGELYKGLQGSLK